MKICYAITKSRRYGLENKISLAMDNSGSQYLSFASRAEARAWIRRLVEGPTNYLESNESIPPIYEITEVGSRSFAMRTSALEAAQNGQGRQEEIAGSPPSFIATTRRMPESLSTFVSGRIVEARDWLGEARGREFPRNIPAIQSAFSGPVSLDRGPARLPRRWRSRSLFQ